MKPRVLVFDFGNVLCRFDHRLATNRLAPLSRLQPDAFHLVLFGSIWDDRYERGLMTTAEFRNAIRSESGLDCTDEFFDEAYADIFEHHRELCDLLPELARRYPLILLSNTNDLHARKFSVQFAEEFRLFRHLLFSHELKTRKPERAIFEAAMKLADCAPEEVMFFDDLESNVAGASAFGWQGVVFTSADDVRPLLD